MNQEITNSEIFPKHYYAFRKDRNIHGGGVFILVDKKFSCSQVFIDSPCEVVWVQLHVQNNLNVILGSFYCPPHSPASIWEELSECVQQIQQMFPDTVLILGGDFNCPGIDWCSGDLTESYLSASFRESLIMLSQDFLLEQIVTEPTRLENILDLCFIYP